MSRCDAGLRRPLPVRLVVPAVERGDLGMVVTVEAVEWDGGPRHWTVTMANGYRYVLPERLNEWARSLDCHVRRQVVALPVVMAFARYGGTVTARILSTAQSV